jgi:hypothetical protein
MFSIVHGFLPVFSGFSPANFAFATTRFVFDPGMFLTSTGVVPQITLQVGMKIFFFVPETPPLWPSHT